MLFDNLPKPVYEFLPVLYVAGGVGSVFWSDNLVGMAAGSLLAVAGVHVWLVRKRYRADQMRRRARINASLRRSRNVDAH